MITRQRHALDSSAKHPPVMGSWCSFFCLSVATALTPHVAVPAGLCPLFSAGGAALTRPSWPFLQLYVTQACNGSKFRQLWIRCQLTEQLVTS